MLHRRVSPVISYFNPYEPVVDKNWQFGFFSLDQPFNS
jgi:hypothetical protein